MWGAWWEAGELCGRTGFWKRKKKNLQRERVEPHTARQLQWHTHANDAASPENEVLIPFQFC